MCILGKKMAESKIPATATIDTAVDGSWKTTGAKWYTIDQAMKMGMMKVLAQVIHLPSLKLRLILITDIP